MVSNKPAYASRGVKRRPRYQYDPTNQENDIDASYGLWVLELTELWHACRRMAFFTIVIVVSNWFIMVQ